MSGPVPASLFKLELNKLYLNSNELSGHLPSGLDKNFSLWYLYLDSNQFTGNIPGGLPYYLTEFDVSANNLTGTIPASIGGLHYLKILSLSHNKLRGQIPSTFKNLKTLKKLYLSNNNLKDTVPASLASLPELNELYIQWNHFTFDGIEQLAQHNFKEFRYDFEKKINIHQNNNILAVNAGGTLSNNTYKWFNNGVLISTINGDSTLTPTASGNYSVEVTNSIAAKLTLRSDTVSINALATVAKNNSNAIQANDKTSFSIYPNPAKTTAIIAFNETGNCSIKLTDVSGRVLQTKTIVAAKGRSIVKLDISKYAKGVYLVTIVNEKNESQTKKLNKQ